MAMMCSRIIDGNNPLKPFLDQTKLLIIVAEANKMLPHFKA